MAPGNRGEPDCCQNQDDYHGNDDCRDVPPTPADLVTNCLPLTSPRFHRLRNMVGVFSRLGLWQIIFVFLQQVVTVETNCIRILFDKGPHIEITRQFVKLLIFNRNQVSLLNLGNLLEVV